MLTNPLVAAVIHNGRATLNELRTIYSLEDLYRLWEIDYVPMYNEWYEGERRKEKDRLNMLMRSMSR